MPAKAAGALAKMEDGEEERPVEIGVRRCEFRSFWEHDDGAFQVVLGAMSADKKTGIHSIFACGYCAKHWGNPDPATPLVRRFSAIAASANYGRQAWPKGRGVGLPGMLEKPVLSKARMHSVIAKITANGREMHAGRLTGNVLAFLTTWW